MRKHFICIMVIAQGTEHRVQSTGHGAQGTIEYLIIIAIVIVIALVVVSLLTGMLSPAQGVGQSINKVGNWSNSIALTETSVTPDGNYLVRLANNSGEEFTVSNVKIGDTNANYSQDLFQGNAQNFVIDSSDACSTGDGVTKTVTITYVSKNGITKTEVYPADTYFSCENYTVSLLADQCEVCSSASYDGNANDANVLAGYSFYSNNDTLLYGTIDTITPGASSTLFTSGYYASDFNLSVIDIDLNADNISSGVDIFGITGTASAGATLVWGDYNSTADTWFNHMDNCSILGSVDVNDWRLPTYDEMDPMKATYIANGENLWIGTTVPSSTSLAYTLDSGFGVISSGDKTAAATYGVRCVRSE